MTIDLLRDAIVAAGGDPTARELAEALWLGHHLRPRAPAVQPGPEADTAAGPGPADDAVADVSAPLSGAEPAPAPVPPRAPTPTSLHIPPTRTGTATAAEVAVPRSIALADRLRFQRTLRPLMRRVPNRRLDVLDEDATVRAVAEHMLADQPWRAVLTPSTERWLDAAVVVDSTASMTLWRDLSTSVADTLASSGVFRQVSRWRLHGDDAGVDAALSTWRGETRRPAELIDPTGRRIVIVISDCVDRIWHTGAAGAFLHRWARHGPVSILQPLPERMWSRTGGRTMVGALSAPRPGAPNTDLRFAAFDGLPAPDGTVVPVLEVSPRWVGRWTRLLSGVTAVTAAVTVVTGERVPNIPVRERATPSPTDRVRHFRSSASPEAFRLAGYVAMSEPVLPVIRYIQHAMFRSAPPSQLAEVLLSGLLRVVDGQAGRYRFVDGVQPLLLDTLQRPDLFRAGELLDELSQAVQARVGVAREHFTALTPGPGRAGITTDSRPFAVINNIGRARLDRIAARPSAPAAAPPTSPAELADTGPAAPDLDPEPGDAGPDGPATRDEATATGAPADLLAPHHRVVRFSGRAADLADLRRWCDSPGSAVRVIAGGAGQGKTRLVLELLDSRSGRWRDAPVSGADTADIEDGGLVVVDHAETRLDTVRRELTRAAHGVRPLRLLLLARSAGDWWQELRRTNLLFGEGTVQQLQAPWAAGNARQAALRDALTDLATRLDTNSGTDYWQRHAASMSLPSADDDHYSAPVTLHLAALRLLVRTGAERPPVSVPEVVAALVAQERRYGEGTAVAARISYARPGQLDEYVGAAALYGAERITDAHEVVRRVRPEDATDRATVHRLATWLHELYPGAEGEYWGPVEPDAVRHDLAVTAASRNPALVTGIIPFCTPAQSGRAMTVLGSACHRHPHLAEPLWQVVRDQPALLVTLLQALKATAATPPPALAARLRTLVQDPRTPPPMVRAVAEGMPDPGFLFADQPAAESTKLVQGARRLGEIDRYLPWLAEALGHHRRVLLAHGSGADVLDVLTDEVDLWQRIVDIAGQSSSARLVQRLTSALDAQADHLHRAGLTVQALSATNRAVAHHHHVHLDEPDSHLTPVCASEIRQAWLLGELTRIEEGLAAAESAVRHARTLFDAERRRSDRTTETRKESAHAPAAVLVHLSDALGALAAMHRLRHDAASALAAEDERVDLHRQLVTGDQIRRAPALAKALLRQAMDLGEVGSPQVALTAADEAVAIYRTLAAEGSSDVLAALATAQHCRAVLMHDLERHDEAALAFRDVVVIHRRLATADPARYREDLATVLRQQAGLLLEAGDVGAAIEALTESCEIRGRLFRDDAANATLSTRLAREHRQLADLWERVGDEPNANRHRLQARLLDEGRRSRG
ncbi:tetratricopeptide repeat protein [Micromonospora sp. PSH03]|uniref:tetratricopeptide repeat protein n=1 Tax=Micromonospora salmantinae TaxID=2911211 RepID=UPI001EE78A7E|nr:tetratricopeptide repeat protein [Micromonospora salmantinae]MCG5455760.1 tetratricopeptide repeat protein [Micromonospora salmantinae]